MATLIKPTADYEEAKDKNQVPTDPKGIKEYLEIIPKPVGYRMLVRPWSGHKKTKGGLLLTEDTADMTMALILAVPRRLSEGERMLRSGEWTGWSPTSMQGHRINGKRLGIIGMGRIGQAVAKRAKGFGLSIHYHNRQRVHEDIEAVLEATYWESLDQMLARMDFISVNCPHTPATFHLLSARRLKLLQPHAVLVNTSRGEVIDENALTRILAAGDIGGAGLDVFENEPAVNPKLLAMENVVLLPHMGSATFEGRIDMGEKVLVNIKTFCDGHTSPDRVLSDIF